MLIYLSKKISIPNNAKINTISWSSKHGWIAIGGQDGLLKILKLDAEGKDNKGVENLSMNQNLEGHSSNVQAIAWNEHFQKLTSSDDNGLIIVWMLHNRSWYEEMINNRNKSVVKAISWNSNGQKICIVYEDGVVIVGSVDGNRIWGKEFKKISLTEVQWSPNSKYLLFAIRTGEVHIYDDRGIFMNKMKIVCWPSAQVVVSIAGLCWYDGRNGYVSSDCPRLAVVYQSGHIQLMRNVYDNNPIVLDTSTFIADCHWNHDGSILAIIGSTVLTGENKESSVIQFFSPFGKSIRSLKLPGETVSSFSWEGFSLRLALAIDSCIYFANVRPDYNWCYFSDTIVFAYIDVNKIGIVVTFWNIKNNKCYQKILPSLISLAAYQEYCVLATLSESSETQYTLMICNSATTIIDLKYMDMKPVSLAMNSTHVFAVSYDNFLMWQYVTPKSFASSLRYAGSRYRKERVYHIDDTPSGVAELIQDLDKDFVVSSTKRTTNDRIQSLACTENTLLIGRKSGTIQRYTLPQVALIQRIHINICPQSISINCNSSRASIIDSVGTLHIITIDKSVNVIGDNKKDNDDVKSGNSFLEAVKRHDVWAMKWASDNPALLAISEKSKLYVLKEDTVEEPINTSAYIAEFKDLEIKSIWLDEIMQSPDNLRPEFVVNYEIKHLRDMKQLLQKSGLSETIAFIERDPHPRLWSLLAEHAVQNLDFVSAESVYARYNNYAGIQLVKRLSNIQSDQLKKAEISAYFKKYDEAENLYLKADRRDLAINLREKLGDWFRVVELMKLGTITSDSLLTKAYDNIGDFFAEQRMWESAKDYYQKAGNYEKLIMCYQYLEDYKELEACISLLSEGSRLLERIGEIFFSVGMCSEAVAAYVKFGAHQAAVDVCISLKKWNQALDISKQLAVNVPIMELIEQQATQLIAKNRILDAVQLYKSAEKYLEAAELLNQVADEKRQSKSNTSPMVLKKLYVLVALLVEQHVNLTKSNRLKSAGAYSKAVTGLNTNSVKNFKLVDNCWHGAEAYHFLMLSQRQLIKGDITAALMAAVTLKSYDDILPPETIFCIISIIAITCRAFEIASNAFTELESLNTNLTEEYEKIAMSIFSKHVPKDPIEISYKCSNCTTVTSLWNHICPNCETRRITCICCGKIIDSLAEAWNCNICKHSICYTEIASVFNCPLCHSPMK